MSALPTVSVPRPDGKGFHLVNADSVPAAEHVFEPVAAPPKATTRKAKP
jgi:hypothetical protein